MTTFLCPPNHSAGCNGFSHCLYWQPLASTVQSGQKSSSGQHPPPLLSHFPHKYIRCARVEQQAFPSCLSKLFTATNFAQHPPARSASRRGCDLAHDFVQALEAGGHATILVMIPVAIAVHVAAAMPAPPVPAPPVIPVPVLTVVVVHAIAVATPTCHNPQSCIFSPKQDCADRPADLPKGSFLWSTLRDHQIQSQLQFDTQCRETHVLMATELYDHAMYISTSSPP